MSYIKVVVRCDFCNNVGYTDLDKPTKETKLLPNGWKQIDPAVRGGGVCIHRCDNCLKKKTEKR